MFIYIIIGVSMLASMAVQQMLKSKFKKYSRIPMASGISGREIAARMLADAGISDVTIQSVPGQLTDHYNPVNKTVNLSPEVHDGRSVAAAAVAAHEVGHAVQHARSYAWLGMRSKLVPVVSASSKYMHWILLAGFVALQWSAIPLLVGIAMFAATTLFSFVTLPVEFDASKRALAWIDKTGVVSSRQHDQASDALRWAAMTYVVAALSSLAMLLYYVSIFLGRRD